MASFVRIETGSGQGGQRPGTFETGRLYITFQRLVFLPNT